MKRSLITGAFVGLLALASTAFAAKSETDTQGNLHHLTGVVTKVNKGANTLTLVLPVGSETDIARSGRSVIVEEGVNLISLTGALDKNAQVWRNGKQAKLSDIKEGDVIRTAFDPSTSKFETLSAVSQKTIDSNIDKARTDLKHEAPSTQK